jgi:hypothetical protein
VLLSVVFVLAHPRENCPFKSPELSASLVRPLALFAPLAFPGRLALRNNGSLVRRHPLPLLFSQVFILKGVKVLCFDTLLQGQ